MTVNKFPGRCYRCLQIVKPGDGMAHKNFGRWWTQHAKCHDTGRRLDDDGNVIIGISHHEATVEQVPISDPEYIALKEADRLKRMKRKATGTGEGARRARKYLREQAGLIGEEQWDEN